MEITETYFAKDRSQWRKWLEKNHEKKTEVWLLRYKKHVKKKCISYNDSVEEALCFGWIDSTLKRVDDEKHYQRFTPRKNTTLWCNNNRVRVRRLIEEGKMTPAGLEKIHPSIDIDEDEPWMTKDLNKVMPKWLEKIFRSDKAAWEFYSSLAPSSKRIYVFWILDAKRDETRKRRAKKTLERLKNKQKPGM